MPSTLIRTFAYDEAAATLDITFVNGAIYRYAGVPPKTAEAMRRAFAKGEFFNRHIRGRFVFERLAASPQRPSPRSRLQARGPSPGCET